MVGEAGGGPCSGGWGGVIEFWLTPRLDSFLVFLKSAPHFGILSFFL